MNWLIQFLEDLLTPFSEADRRLIISYWESTFGISKNFYQKMLEVDADRNIQTLLPHHKEFSHAYNFQEKTVEFERTIESIPHYCDGGMCDYTFLVAPYHVAVEITTPWKIPTFAENLSISGLASTRYETREGYILSTGSEEVTLYVEYDDRAISGGSVEKTGLLVSGPANLQKYTGTEAEARASEKRPFLSGIAEVVAGNYLYDPEANFNDIELYSLYKSGSVEARVVEIKDKHTILIDPPHHALGERVSYEIDAYPWAYYIDDYPVFPDLNYKIENGIIGFSQPPKDTLVASEVVIPFENPFIPLLDGPSDFDQYKAVWASVFLGATPESLNLMLHALMGLPWVLPTMGTLRIDELDYSYTWSKSLVKFVVKNKTVTTDIEYFTPMDQAIKIDDKIICIRRILSQYSCYVDYDLPDGEYYGVTGDFVCHSISVTDSFGHRFSIAVPEKTYPRCAPGDYCPIWFRLTTGVRVYDRTMVPDYIKDVDITRFIAGPGYDPVKAQRRLVANTFVIEYDIAGLNLDYYKQCVPGWTEYILRNNTEEDAIGLYESLVVFEGYILWLGKMFDSMDFVPKMCTVLKLYEVGAVTDDALPQFFTATYVAGALVNPNVGGTPLDLTGEVAVDAWTNLWYTTDTPYKIESFDLGSTTAVLNIPIPGYIDGTDYDFCIMRPTAIRMSTPNIFLGIGGTIETFTIGRFSGAIGYSKDPYWPEYPAPVGYVPGIYNLGDFTVNELKHYSFSNRTVDTGVLIDFDYERQGARIGMTVTLSGLNAGTLFSITDFSSNGEVVLNPVPINDTNLTVDIYAFCLRHNDGTITTFGE